MTASRTPHRRSSGAIRKLSSGRYQARYTGPDGLLRSLGTFATKTEADQVLAHETSQMARGTWRDPRLGDEPLGAWFRDWLATRGDLADSTHELYGRLIDHWIDAPVQVARATGHAREINLGTQMLGSVTSADVRAWDSAVLAECIARATARWERAQRHPRRVNAAIRVWAAENGLPVASTGRIPAALRQAWLDETGGVPATDKVLDRNAGKTEAAQAYRLLHTGM